jgi:hypothetical protein
MIRPTSTVAFPQNLTLKQFIQTLLAGLTGIDGKLVRPDWQPNPPKNPAADIDWLAFGVNSFDPDANAFTGTNTDGVSTTLQRHEKLTVGCRIYGPNSENTWGLLRDGFQLSPNREALTAANMGFVEVRQGMHVPSLVNEEWIDSIQTDIILRRQIQRIYSVSTFVSASGTIFAPISGNGNYQLDFLVDD